MAYSFSVLLRHGTKSNLKVFNKSLMYRLSVTAFKLEMTCFITLQHSRLQFKPSIPPLFLVNVVAIHACTDRAREIAEVYGARDSFPIPLYIISGSTLWLWALLRHDVIITLFRINNLIVSTKCMAASRCVQRPGQGEVN